MVGQSCFQAGQTVVLREMWDGKIWSARPAIVVQDNPDLMAFYIPTGVVSSVRRASDGSPASVDNRVRSEWILSEEVEWPEYERLKLTIPGSGYSVIIFSDFRAGTLSTWYINLEEPIGRTHFSYDYIDLLLDVIASPDLSEWRWDDEDELEEVVKAGLISLIKAAELYTEGERVVAWLQSGTSPFNGWQKWCPDPSWQVPVLPEGWDIID
ncbi:MAG TPA: DUF402 domain-containing protein [Dehalococcoidia bacterium]|nr:DUF402 domain-containing protein [Dehalococcoidia bacterium]